MFKFYTDSKYLPKGYKVYKLLPRDFFNQFVKGSDFLNNEDVHKMVYRIEMSKFINSNLIETAEGEIISVSDLATGLKTIINHMFLASYPDRSFSQEFVQNFNFTGYNVIKEMLEEDYMQKYDNFPIFITYGP